MGKSGTILLILMILSIGLYGKELPREKYLPGIVIVKFNDNLSPESTQAYQKITDKYSVHKIQNLFSDRSERSLSKRRLNSIYRLHFPNTANIPKICAILNSQSDVAYAEPDYLFFVEDPPNDPYFNIQYHLTQIRAPEAWEIIKGDSTVVIGIVDTGVDWDHPDLAEAIWTNASEQSDGLDSDNNGYIDDIRGWDFFETYAAEYPPAVGEDAGEADNDPMDFDGHGTHVAGIAAAITDNEKGVASVSWNCAIMPLRAGYRAADGDGYIIMSYAAEALVYAADNGADIVNLSTSASQTILEAARYAYDKGLVITKSAGNNNSNINDPLEAEPYCLTVTAVDRFDVKSWYSDYGDWVSLSAPGGSPFIYSTVIDKYGSEQGTSFCAPQAAGVAGLIKTQHPDWSAADIIFQIIQTADDIDHLNPAYTGLLGSGRLNAQRAVSEVVTEQPEIRLNKLVITGGDDDGLAESGEQILLIVEFINRMGSAKNANAELKINHWAVSVEKSMSNYGDIPGLRDLNHNTADNLHDPFVIRIDSLAIPQRVAGSVELITQNGFSKSFEISFSISPSILIVDDEELNIESYYFAALDSLGVAYDYWNHDLHGSPASLDRYPTVIWFCGDWTFPSLDEDDRGIVRDYLHQGGHFFLSGQDIGWDMCDPNPPKDFANQYTISNGLSKTFYEDYLHAIYLTDVSGNNTMSGVPGDPIGDGITFQIFQPGRPLNAQYPSEIAPNDSAVSIFNYPNQRSGAVRYAGDYRSVYFAFGGWEAIVGETLRFDVMNRVLQWLNGVRVIHTPLSDIGDTSRSRTVSAKILSEINPVERVDLYWDTDSEFPYHREQMEHMGENIYAGEIPAVGMNSVNYFILARTENGYSTPVEMRSYSSVVDTIPPVITLLTHIPNSIARESQVPVFTEIIDDFEIDTTSAQFLFRSTSDDTGSFHLVEHAPERFGGVFKYRFAFGDTVYYKIAASDLAEKPNYSESDEKFFVTGLEDFESGLTHWRSDSAGWALDSLKTHSGKLAISDHSGFDNGYPNNSESIIMLDYNLDLSGLNFTMLRFWTYYELEQGKDFGFVEISRDSGFTWQQIGESITGRSDGWSELSYSLQEYIDINSDVLTLRFRMTSDSTQSESMEGWIIDDVQIVSKRTTSLNKFKIKRDIPDQYYLAQNYPNPFNPSTFIGYGLSKDTDVDIAVFNLIGQKIITLVKGFHPAGSYEIGWNGLDEYGASVASGIYFYTIRTNEFLKTNKMIMMK